MGTPGNLGSERKKELAETIEGTVRHAAFMWATYNLDLDLLLEIVKDAYEVAKMPSAPPPAHHAYSSKHLGGKERLFHSRGLPEGEDPKKNIVPGVNAPRDYSPGE